MAVPKRRTSKTKKRMRRTHYKIEAVGMVKCSNCGEMITPHRVCPICGFYKGKNVIEKAPVTEEVVEKKVKEPKEKKVKEPKEKKVKEPKKKKETKAKKETK